MSESKKNKLAGSKFSVHAKEIKGVTQAEHIENFTPNFGDAYSATVTGSGSVAQGMGSMAAGKRGVVIGGDVADSVVITGDGNTVKIEKQKGGIRAGQIHAKNVVDGIQAQGVLPRDLPDSPDDAITGGIEADTIHAESVVSGLQVIDEQTDTGTNEFWQSVKNFVKRLHSADNKRSGKK